MKRTIAVCIFYDTEGNVYLQDRRNCSKAGEIYGFWGGGLEEGEKPEGALRRELQEELNFTYKGEFDYLLTRNFKVDRGKLIGWDIELHAYCLLVSKKIVNSWKIEEGTGVAIFRLDTAVEAKVIDKRDRDILKYLSEHINE